MAARHDKSPTWQEQLNRALTSHLLLLLLKELRLGSLTWIEML
jgi:hypothetical protein